MRTSAAAPRIETTLLALLGLLLGSLLGLKLLAGVALVGWTIRPLSLEN
ncbi:MAG: hypothetical protein NZ782_02025 [Candidatus Poseidoniia archaeon]|nr:hypothetical protein [Candidatus Poseidoniia archaeon]